MTAETQYFIGNEKVSWKMMTLQTFTQHIIPDGWEDVFEEAEEDIIPKISQKVAEYRKKTIVYPPLPLVFNILEALQPKQVKVVILGQDPYINRGQAMGYSFSVPDNIKIPPSLKNIYKELVNEGYEKYASRKTGNLTDWVDKGVFLYNTCLTVNKRESGSHGMIWKEFTRLVIARLNQEDNIAWILLGGKAKKYADSLDKQRHGIFMAAHPSPVNTGGGFLGSNVFAKAEKYLQDNGSDFEW